MDAAWGLRGDMGPDPGPYRILYDMNYESISKDAVNGSFHAYHSMFEADLSWRTSQNYLFDPLVGLRYTELDAIRTFDITNTATASPNSSARRSRSSRVMSAYTTWGLMKSPSGACKPN